jgi:hypothetical protein
LLYFRNLAIKISHSGRFTQLMSGIHGRRQQVGEVGVDAGDPKIRLALKWLA